MNQEEMRWPRELVAVDWGSVPARRPRCRAVLRAGRYVLLPPEPVEDPASMPLEPGTLVGIDCCLGLPPTYATRAELESFRDGLQRFGRPPFERFYEPCEQPEEVCVERPFYPARPGGASREVLQRALGSAAFEPRACDRVSGGGPLFWLVGPKQVGKASITVWRDVLTPRLEQVALWPFDGPLPSLLESGRCVVAELYPALMARLLGLQLSGKRDHAVRCAAGRELLARRHDKADLFEVRGLLEDGCGTGVGADDAFDALVACLGLVMLIVRGQIAEPPEELRSSEGWMLGL